MPDRKELQPKRPASTTADRAQALVSGGKTVHTRRLFDGIAKDYDAPAQWFSLFQYLHWRRFLVSRLTLDPQSQVLDVATGPGGVAIAMNRGTGCQVVGMDISDQMLSRAQRTLDASGLADSVTLVKARAEDLPFANGTFDAVVFTFLLRYVAEPQATVRELSRVLKPGGQMASLEFYVPGGPILHPLWLLHTRLVLPLGTRFLSSGWSEVGSFLGPSISNFFSRYKLDDLDNWWTRAGITDVRTKKLSTGGALVMWGRKANPQ